MEYKTIRKLLEKYLEGRTDQQEERYLREFFRTVVDVPEDLEPYRSMFDYFEKESRVRSGLAPADIINTPATGKKTKKIRQTTIFRAAAVAATLLILAGVFLLNRQEGSGKIYAIVNGEPVTNEQVAYQETKRALDMVSSNLNHGTEDLKHLTKFHQAKQLLTQKQGL